MKQETPTSPQINPTDPPKKEESERTTDQPKVFTSSVAAANREPTLLDSHGEPVRDIKREPTSRKESIMPSTDIEQGKGLARDPQDGKQGSEAKGGVTKKATTVIGQAGEGAQEVARTASEAAEHAASGAKEVLSDAREGARDVGGAAQKAASHALEASKEVIGDIAEGAKNLGNTALAAADETKEVLQKASRGVAESIKETKDRALHSVSSAMHQVGPSIRRANRATGSFVAGNAVPISLLGFGAGWLLMSARRRPSVSRDEPRMAVNVSASPEMTSPEAKAKPVASNGGARHLDEGAKLLEATGERLHDAASEASKEIRHVAEEARHRAREVKERAVHQLETARDVVSERTARLKRTAGERLERAKQSTSHLAETNPLALVALSLGAGMSTAMLFPSSKPERRLMGAARDRLVAEASDTASRVGGVARETARGLRDSFRP